MNWRKQLYKFIQLPVLLGGVLFSGNSSTVNLSAAEADDMITVSSRQALKACGSPRCKTLGYIYPGQEAKSIKRYRYWVKIKYRVKIRYRGGKTRYRWRTFWVRKPSVKEVSSQKDRHTQAGCSRCSRQRSGHSSSQQAVREIADFTRTFSVTDSTSKPTSRRSSPRHSSVSQAQMDRYMKEVETQAYACRRTSDLVRAKTGRSRICGNQYKGMCYQAVKKALVKSGMVSRYFVSEFAIEAHSKGYLKREGYINYISQYNEKNAPLGCILVYSGGTSQKRAPGGAGHIEAVINTGSGRKYCSDFCSARPISVRLPRKLRGVYCK